MKIWLVGWSIEACLQYSLPLIHHSFTPHGTKAQWTNLFTSRNQMFQDVTKEIKDKSFVFNAAIPRWIALRPLINKYLIKQEHLFSKTSAKHMFASFAACDYFTQPSTPLYHCTGRLFIPIEFYRSEYKNGGMKPRSHSNELHIKYWKGKIYMTM